MKWSREARRQRVGRGDIAPTVGGFGIEVMDALIVLAQRENAAKQDVFGLSARPSLHARCPVRVDERGYDICVEQPALHKSTSRPAPRSRVRSRPVRSRPSRNATSGLYPGSGGSDRSTSTTGSDTVL